AYASLVHRRERPRRRREALAGLRALWLGRHRGAWAEVDGEPVRARVLLVANNAYELSLFSIGERAAPRHRPAAPLRGGGLAPPTLARTVGRTVHDRRAGASGRGRRRAGRAGAAARAGDRAARTTGAAAARRLAPAARSRRRARPSREARPLRTRRAR